MITIFGQSLVYWTGVLTGIFFIFSFLGCRVILWLAKNSKIKFLGKLAKFAIIHHQKFIYLTFVFFLIHATLAILRANFNIWI